MACFRASVEYDGTAYYGFQRQTDAFPTIQSSVEQALTAVCQQPVSITGAGRTDTGVHALGQVINFTIDWRHGEAALLRALNANLPSDIAIYQLKTVSPSFHARYDAVRRAYQYHIYISAVRSPIRRNRSWQLRQRLNVDEMNASARYLIGEHDFSTFGSPPKGTNCVRRVFEAKWQQKDEMLLFYIEANAFLYRMVRSLVGSMKLVGEGKWSVEMFREALAAKDRSCSGKVAPPQGLYLYSVQYD